MNFHPRPLRRLLSLSALAAICTLGAPGCRRRNPMPTPGEENTIPLPNPQPNPQQNEPGAPQPKPVRRPKPGADRVVQPNANLPVVLKSDKATYRRGETLSFTITLRNASDQTQTLSFNSGQNFDLIARRAGADANVAPVWRWATGKAFTFEIRDVSLRPGEEREFTATWDQSVGDVQAVPRGSYVITSEIAAVPRLPSNAVTVELAN